MRAGDGRQAVEQRDELSGGVGGRHHQDRASAKTGTGCVANTNAGDHLFDVSGDLAANDVLVSFEGHGSEVSAPAHARNWNDA